MGLDIVEEWKLERAGITPESNAYRIYSLLAAQCRTDVVVVLRVILAKVTESLGISKRTAQYGIGKLKKAGMLKQVCPADKKGAAYMFPLRGPKLSPWRELPMPGQPGIPPRGYLVPDDVKYRQFKYRWTEKGFFIEGD